MNRIVLIGLLGLAGCSMFPAPFDSVEYEHAAILAYQIDQTHRWCGDPQAKVSADAALEQVRILVKFSEDIPDDQEVRDAALVLEGLVIELDARLAGQYSKAYCEFKTKELTKAAHELKATMARRPTR